MISSPDDASEAASPSTTMAAMTEPPSSVVWPMNRESTSSSANSAVSSSYAKAAVWRDLSRCSASAVSKPWSSNSRLKILATSAVTSFGSPYVSYRTNASAPEIRRQAALILLVCSRLLLGSASAAITSSRICSTALFANRLERCCSSAANRSRHFLSSTKSVVVGVVGEFPLVAEPERVMALTVSRNERSTWSPTSRMNVPPITSFTSLDNLCRAGMICSSRRARPVRRVWRKRASSWSRTRATRADCSVSSGYHSDMDRLTWAATSESRASWMSRRSAM